MHCILDAVCFSSESAWGRLNPWPGPESLISIRSLPVADPTRQML